MIRYIIRRLLWAIVLFIAVTMVTYIIFFVVPTDPAFELCGKSCAPDDIARVKHYWHLDKPVPVQYYYFLKRLVVNQSLGRSFANRQDVNEIIADAAPVTASLVIGGAILWMLIAIPLGVLSALRPRSLLELESQ